MTGLSRRRVGRLSYQVSGDGGDPVLLMMAGYGRSGSSWIPWLDRVGPLPFRVVLLDHRGTGESARTWRPYTMATLADDAAEVLGDARAIVVGDSMGGMVAQHLAIRHPHRVAGLVLSASSAGGGAISPEFLRSLPITVAAALSKDVRVWRKCDRLLVHETADPELLAPLRAVQRQEPYSRLNSLLQAIAMSAHRTARRLGAVRVPVELIVGAGDRVLSPRNSRVLAERLPDARLTVLPDTGHAIAFERPMEIRHAVTRLVARSGL